MANPNYISSDSIVKIDGVRIPYTANTLKVNGVEVELTKKAYTLGGGEIGNSTSINTETAGATIEFELNNTPNNLALMKKIKRQHVVEQVESIVQVDDEIYPNCVITSKLERENKSDGTIKVTLMGGLANA